MGEEEEEEKIDANQMEWSCFLVQFTHRFNSIRHINHTEISWTESNCGRTPINNKSIMIRQS